MKRKNLIFDLDATLYYAGDKVEKLCDEKVFAFFSKKLGISKTEAKAKVEEIRRRYTYDVDALEGEFPFSKKEFMDEICNVDMSLLAPDKELADLLQQLPQAKYILTDSTRRHVKDTLQALGVNENLFTGIFDAHDMGYIFKYNPKSFNLFLQKYNLDASDCILFEDSKRNINVAKNLGFETVLIRPENIPEAKADYWFPDIKSACLAIARL